jgi:predicted nucleotidyltransferase
MIQLSGLSAEETKKFVPPQTLLLGYCGSLAHGTHIPKTDPNSIDDKDIMGVCVAPLTNYLGLSNFEQLEKKEGEWDSVVYEVRKYIRLLLKQNPNVLGLLWLQKKDYIYVGESRQELLDNRGLFVSKLAYHSFSGYAYSQLHKMTHGAFNGYMGKKRKELVDKFGFDAKNGSHLIRLLRMGIEFLTEGELHVFREDASELKEIKAGQWTLEEVKEEAERLFSLAREAYVRSKLSDKPDAVKAEELLIKILRRELRL